MFVEVGAGVIDAGGVVVPPDILDLAGGFPFDEGHHHYLSEFAGAGVGEGHPEPDQAQLHHHEYYNEEKGRT